MVDLATEDWFPLAESKKKLPTKPHYMTVWRWHRFGKRVNGNAIKLEAVPTVHGLATSVEAYLRFQNAIRAAVESRACKRVKR